MIIKGGMRNGMERNMEWNMEWNERFEGIMRNKLSVANSYTYNLAPAVRHVSFAKLKAWQHTCRPCW